MSQSQEKEVSMKENNMDMPEHQTLYAQGLEIRKKVVGEDYVENALEKGKSDFMRPLQQFATVCALPNFSSFS
jgi:4-carboxymuconolactone decarboxylase